MEEEKGMEKRKSGAWKVIIVIILMIAFGALGFYLGFNDAFNLKEENKTVEPEILTPPTDENQPKVEIDKSVLSERVNNILTNASFREFLYYGEEINDYYKNSMYLNMYSDKWMDIVDEEERKYDNGMYSKKVSYDEVASDYNKYFTGILSKTNNYEYDFKNDYYYLKTWGVESYWNSYLSELEYEYENNNYLVSLYIGYIRWDAGENFPLCTDVDCNNEIKVFATEEETKNFKITEENKNLFSKVTLTFIKDDSGNFLFDTATIDLK